MNKFSDFIRSEIDYLKTLLWNLFAPNVYKLLYQRYIEMRDALDERDEEYETDITLADEKNRALMAENERLRAFIEGLSDALRDKADDIDEWRTKQ